MIEIVERSPRSTNCYICYKAIPAGGRRIDVKIGSGYYPAHCHIGCFKKKYSKVLHEILKK